MAQVVEAQGSKPGAFLSTAQAAPYRRVVERPAEHKVLVIDETATVGETCQLGRGGRGERDRARPTPLRGLELPGRHGGGYCEGAPLEAHLPPAQRAQLAKPQAGEGGDGVEGGVLLVGEAPLAVLVFGDGRAPRVGQTIVQG